ncbi:MAG: hypothetical protein HZB56_23835 [Deltaproteobacteria bacterium]|nr:hypothetical protein [Deltaproteobacteria bacterium]
MAKTKTNDQRTVEAFQKRLPAILACLGAASKAAGEASADGVEMNLRLIREFSAPRGAFEGALETLRGGYGQAVHEAAEALAPLLKRRVYRGWTDDDGERAMRAKKWTPPFHAFEEAVARRILGSSQRVALVLLVSPWVGVKVGTDDPTWHQAMTAAALDVLQVAAREGWYKPRPGEEPSTKLLLGGPEKMARALAPRVRAAREWLEEHKPARAA